MNEFAFLAIGGGPTGLSAVRGYRKAGGGGPVAIVTDEHELPYRRPPLSKEFLRGELEACDLQLEDVRWLEQNEVSLICSRAVALDHNSHRVTLSGGRALSYESCLIATGAEPERLPIPGADHPGVHVLRSLDDTRRILRDLRPGAQVCVIGSGFIGCEMAASLRSRGHGVVLISDEPAPNQRRLGDDSAAKIEDWLRAEDVALHLGHRVEEIAPLNSGLTIRTAAATLSADLVVMAAGVSPRGELVAPHTDLDDGAIPADASLRTALQDVFAAGDVCKARNETAQRSLRVEHWGDALAQGEIAGANAAGADRKWSEVPGFWSTIGRRTLKYAAWGDGYDTAAYEQLSDESWVTRYSADGLLVGILVHNADAAYEDGKQQIADEAGLP